VRIERQDRYAQAEARPCSAGFTLIEILVSLLIIGLLAAMIAPNLGAFVPKARLDAAAKVLAANIDFLRSEAKIQGKRFALELDLDRGMWRHVLPPEERLTTEQDVEPLEPHQEEWMLLQEGVRIATAGNANEGLAKAGKFSLVFDHNGQTGDQSIVLQLADDPTMTWTVNIRGLTGQCEILEDFEGRVQMPQETTEGAF
jgi:prepilin-type N-terminal cleavage/methylation domain-containing protein